MARKTKQQIIEELQAQIASMSVSSAPVARNITDEGRLVTVSCNSSFSCRNRARLPISKARTWACSSHQQVNA